MLSKSKIFTQLKRTFENGMEVLVADQLFEFLRGYPKTSHITLQLIRQIGSKNHLKFGDAEIVRALTFLSGDSVQVLSTGFEFVDDDESVHLLTNDQLSEILSDSINPLSGEVDPYIKEKVTMFFFLTEEAQKFFEPSDSEKGLNE
jgi:hypothetical protein